MAHRSNQAVASQEQPAPQSAPPSDPPPRRRLLIGWATALAALGASTAAVALAVWFLRFPIAAFFLGSALAERGAEADFRFVDLDFNRAVLADVRFGSATAPDAAMRSVEARWSWHGLSPRLDAVVLRSPQIRLRVDPAGRVSAGALDRLGGGQGRSRPSLPAISLTIEDGTIAVDAPFGALNGTFHGAGTLGQDFSAIAEMPATSRLGRTHSLTNGAAELVIGSRDDAVAFRFTATADRLLWNGAALDGAQLRIMGRAPLDLGRYQAEAVWRATAVRAGDLHAEVIGGAIGGDAVARDDSLEPRIWQTQARVNAATFAFGDNIVQHVLFNARADGHDAQGQGAWTLSSESFSGLALNSSRPSASGAFRLNLRGNERATGDARVSLAQSRLNAEAQRSLRNAFPDVAQAPVGPTFAQAEAALVRAADRFDLVVPLSLDADESGIRMRIASAAEARAASGALLRLTPLREDAPALTLEFPDAQLHGAVDLELSGGGAPSASLLLDTVDWSPGAPFEGDGTLTLANWRADSASIAADELGIGISISPSGGGHIDLRGPAHITGPLGDGEVRDLVAGLDLTVSWSPGWRVAPNGGCLPVRLGGLDAAGLSFANGAFALCPLNGALIAADARGNLSGGFAIQSLALNGRMSGEAAQPARLSATTVSGRFTGRSGDMTLAVEATSPRIAIEMAADRTLAVTLARMTANAHIADTWRVEGLFDRGSLSDPSLPGGVSTLAGRWSAAPEDDKPVIRVEAAEALLTANRPATDAERPLFNPLRLIDASAVLRDGHIEANGSILLEDRARQLARFTAQHDIDAGAGSAEVTAQDLTFGPDLQPYDITERARGLVDNVTGNASLTADIAWTDAAITSTGRVRLDGVSLATSTIPSITDVRGEIYFDDLFALTTPPGQRVTIGSLNPGVTVRDGTVQFQLLTEERVAIERASFAFAGGELAMRPTTITLGADATEFELTLADVDAGNLIDALTIPDLSATGRVEGSFPLTLTRTSALIHGGVLRALPGGGTISYTGDAGQAATGPAKIAFDALRSFRYDNLALTLDGDLSGDVISSIDFSGHNSGDAVDLGPIMSLPGVGRVTVRGVPFDFNVRVTAPFRRLAQTAASITDPGSLIDQARPANPDEAVDPEPSAPR